MSAAHRKGMCGRRSCGLQVLVLISRSTADNPDDNGHWKATPHGMVFVVHKFPPGMAPKPPNHPPPPLPPPQSPRWFVSMEVPVEGFIGPNVGGCRGTGWYDDAEGPHFVGSQEECAKVCLKRKGCLAFDLDHMDTVDSGGGCPWVRVGWDGWVRVVWGGAGGGSQKGQRSGEEGHFCGCSAGGSGAGL